MAGSALGQVVLIVIPHSSAKLRLLEQVPSSHQGYEDACKGKRRVCCDAAHQGQHEQLQDLMPANQEPETERTPSRAAFPALLFLALLSTLWPICLTSPSLLLQSGVMGYLDRHCDYSQEQEQELGLPEKYH